MIRFMYFYRPVMIAGFIITVDTALLNTQRYKVCIKGKVELYRERSSALHYTLVL